MTYTVIDTNVIVAALMSKYDDAATVQIMAKALSGDLIPVYSESILTEYRDVLQRKKFKFPPDDQEYIISAIMNFGKPVIPIPSSITLPDAKDLPFYDVAKTLPNCYLITGNKKHYPDDIFIVSAREMLDILST